MNNKVIEKSIKRALNEAPSLSFTNIINTPYIKMTEHDFITRQTEAKKVSYPKQFTVGFVSFALLLLCLTGWFVQYRLPDSSITLDVNPSIKIITNKQDRILSIEAINNDAEIVLEQVGERTSDLNQMVPSILEAIIKQGYLTSEKNVVMVSVENKNSKKANALASSLHQLIQSSALSQNINPQILQQTLQKDKESATLASNYHISDGKLRLIKRILVTNPEYTTEALASKSMEELLNIAIDNQVDLSDLLQAGSSPHKTNTNTASPSKVPDTGIAPSTENKIDNPSEVYEVDEDKDHEDKDHEDKDNTDNNDSDDKDVDQAKESEEDQEDKKDDNSFKSDNSKKYNHTTKPSDKEEEDSSSSEDSTDQYKNNSEDDLSNATSSDAVENASDEEDALSDVSIEDTESSDDGWLSGSDSDNEASEEEDHHNDISEND